MTEYIGQFPVFCTEGDSVLERFSLYRTYFRTLLYGLNTVLFGMWLSFSSDFLFIFMSCPVTSDDL
jgi:hypothetical protein